MFTSMLVIGSCVTAYAKNDAGFKGTLKTKNPATSAPWGYAKTKADYDVNSIGAQVAVYNDNKLVDHDEAEEEWEDVAETDKVYGANYASKNTRFGAKYWGTDFDSDPTAWSDSDGYAY